MIKSRGSAALVAIGCCALFIVCVLGLKLGSGVTIAAAWNGGSQAAADSAGYTYDYLPDSPSARRMATGAAGVADRGTVSAAAAPATSLLGMRFGVAAEAPGTALRRVGTQLGSVDDVMANPKLLQGMSPAQVQSVIGKTPAWEVGTLRQGRSAGEGWTLRERNAAGTDYTGRFIQWSPGSSRHFDGAPYWKVSSGPGGTQRWPQ